ncbi:MAG: hypothetical protein V1790_13280 [Planctomycetota bacterium]
MPKTYTDDIAPVLPSSIAGPFQVVNASDINSWIKIDPANARLSAAGSAQPVRRIIVPSARTYASVTNSTIGQYIAAISVSATQLGGQYLTPILVPDNMDVTKPCKVRILISPVSDATTNGQVIRFTLAETHVATDGTRTETVFNHDWNVPDDWITDNTDLITLDNGSGSTFAGDTFQHGQHLALRVARVGTAPEDTFDKSVNIALHAVFEYTATEY